MNGLDYKLVGIRNKFREYYNDALKHRYEKLEPIRRKYLIWFWVLFIFFVIIALSYVWCCIYYDVSSKAYFSEGAVKLYVIYFAIMYGVCSLPLSYYKEKTKFAVMDRILDFWGEFQYSSIGEMINKNFIEKSKLFADFTDQEQDDAFKGSYHGAKIKVSEQKLVRVIHTSKGRRDKTIFKGVLIALELNRKYSDNTVVLGKSNWRTFCRYNFFEVLLVFAALVPIFLIMWFFYRTDFSFLGMGWMGVTLLLMNAVIYFFIFREIVKQWRQKDSAQVHLEDVVFSKKWKVYADNQVEARYVLTPALMERMLAVKKLFHGNRLDFSFWDNNLLIAVHTGKDMFETTSLFKSALDYRKVQEVICQLYSIFSVIDVLKIQNDSRISTKKES